MDNTNFTPAFQLFRKIFTDIPNELLKLSSTIFAKTNINATDYPTLNKLFTKVSNKYDLGAKKRKVCEIMKEYQEMYQHMNDINKTSQATIYKNKPEPIFCITELSAFFLSSL